MIEIKITTETSEEAHNTMRDLLSGYNGPEYLIDKSAIPSILKKQNPVENDELQLKDTVDPESTSKNEDILQLDPDKYPWDERIHSSKHSRNADDTWKLLRIPKEYKKDEAKWHAFIETVRAEYRAKNESQGNIDNPEDVFGNNENPAAGMEDDTTTEETTNTSDTPADFPALMKFITSNDKITILDVNNICSNFGLTDLAALMKPENADMIPMIYNSMLEVIANGAPDES